MQFGANQLMSDLFLDDPAHSKTVETLKEELIQSALDEIIKNKYLTIEMTAGLEPDTKELMVRAIILNKGSIDKINDLLNSIQVKTTNPEIFKAVDAIRYILIKE